VLSPTDYSKSGATVQCKGRISALRITTTPTGEPKLGALMQIEAGTLLDVRGDGYNERTVKVSAGGELFHVFRQDLWPQ
jgi:hypothetical protein